MKKNNSKSKDNKKKPLRTTPVKNLLQTSCNRHFKYR